MREDRGSAALLWFPTVCWQTATISAGVRDRPFENVPAFIRLVALYAWIDTDLIESTVSTMINFDVFPPERLLSDGCNYFKLFVSRDKSPCLAFKLE